MDNLTIKSRFFITAFLYLSLGFSLSFFSADSSTPEHSLPQLLQENSQFQSLEQKISNIDNTLNLLLEQNNLTIKLDSLNEENITSANLKNIIKETMHEVLNEKTEDEITINNDPTSAWEVISQVHNSSVTSDFFNSKEVKDLPKNQKSMVISEIVGRMNRGEIDSDRFFDITK